jgi:hypothetical protein
MLGVVIRAFAISIVLFLCGCTNIVDRMAAARPSQQSNLDEKDENTCRSRGAVPGFQGYDECRKNLADQRASDKAAAEADRQQAIDQGAGTPPGR